MPQMIELMESRMLLSASALVIAQDLAALKGAGVQAKADLGAALKTIAADLKAVKTTVAAAHPTRAQKRLVGTLQKVELAAAAKYKHTIVAILSVGARDGAHLVAALKKLKAHPTNSHDLAKAQAAIVALQKVFSDQVLMKVETNASDTVTKVDTDLNAVATAVPTAQGVVASAEAHLAGDLMELSKQGTAIQDAIAKLAGDLA